MLARRQKAGKGQKAARQKAEGCLQACTEARARGSQGKRRYKSKRQARNETGRLRQDTGQGSKKGRQAERQARYPRLGQAERCK
jgi:hypothetical protein